MLKYRPKTPFYPHQRKAVIQAVKQGSHAFYMVPRAGKTKAALDATAIQALRGRVRRVLVVCPLAAMSVWDEEIEKHYPYSARVSSAGGVAHSVEGRAPLTRFYIINYDLLRYRSRNERKKWVYPYLAATEKWAPDLVILDESHRAKRAGAVTSQALWRMVRRLRSRTGDGVPYVYLLTGTPNPKGYVDLFSQFRIMDDSIFGTNKAGFDERYCIYGTHGKLRFKVLGYRRRKELLRKARSRATIVGEGEIEGMSRVVWQNVLVDLPQGIRALYNELAEELVVGWEGGLLEATNAGVLRLRLSQLTGGFTTEGEQIHDAKLRVARDVFADTLELEQPLVCYCAFLPEVEGCAALLRKMGSRTEVIRGSVSPEVRTQIRRDFQAGKLDAVVFQVATGSLAIDLSRSCEIVYYSLPEGWLDYYQSSKRTSAIGKGTPTRIRHLIAPGTVDVSKLRGLRDRADLQAEFMKDPRAYLFGA